LPPGPYFAEISAFARLRPPWWSWILEGGKDIENRSWSTDYRGTILVHASLFSNRTVIEENAALAKAIAKQGRSNATTSADRPHYRRSVRPATSFWQPDAHCA
jgi:hypothetical protein